MRLNTPTILLTGGTTLQRKSKSQLMHTCVLEQKGPQLRHPYSSGVKGSRHSHMRELRVQHQGEPYRVLYAFDPRRIVILLIGGCKSGDGRWYEKFVPLADTIYDAHLESLEREGEW